MKNLVKNLLVILVIIFLFSSCNSDDKSETESTVKVVLTDGPFPFDVVTQANVEMTKIELKNENGIYITVFEGSGNYNMVNLTNGVTADVETNVLEPGTYSEAKITFNAANVQFFNGVSFQANVNTNSAHVVSISPALVVEEGQTSEILLDLDLDNSFEFLNLLDLPISGWISSIDFISGCNFQPQLRACDYNQTGEIIGTVQVGGELFANADVSIEIDGDVIHTHSEADGTFKFIGVKEGAYTVTVDTENVGSVQEEVVVQGTGTSNCTITIN